MLGFHQSPAPKSYTVVLIDSNGRVLRSANAATRLIHADYTATLPEVSTTRTRVYYLDGDSLVRFLGADGSSGTLANRIPVGISPAATSVRGQPGEDVQAAFAVSPDDQRIAVAILHYWGIRLYVEDLSGADHVELYSGPVLEWPVAWWHGQLVLQLADPDSFVINPPVLAYGYGSAFQGYHVVNASTGIRSAAVCEHGVIHGTLSPAGTFCSPGNDGQFSVVSLTGSVKVVTGACSGGFPDPVDLSPDGTKYAGRSCTGQGLAIYGLDGSVRPVNIDPSIRWGPAGWLDDNHVVIGGDLGETCGCPERVVDLTTGYVGPPTGDNGIFSGTVPTQLQ